MKAIASSPLLSKHLVVGYKNGWQRAEITAEKGQVNESAKQLPRSSLATSRRLAVLSTAVSLLPLKPAVGEEAGGRKTVEHSDPPTATTRNADIADQNEAAEPSGRGDDTSYKRFLDFIESLDVTSLWPGVLTGLVGLGGGLWLLAGKPVMSTVVQRLDRGLTRSFLLEKAITTALSREYQAPPVRSGLIEIPLLVREDGESVFQACQWAQGAIILRGPSDTGKTTQVLQAANGRTDVVIVGLRKFRNNLKEGLKEALGLEMSDEVSLLEIVQLLRKRWEKQRGIGDVPVLFIDDSHLLGDTNLFLDKDARADIQLLLELAWDGLCYMVMGTSEEAGAEVLLDQLSGGTRVGLLEYTFPSKTKIVNYLKDNLTCGAELAMEIHRRIGGHMGEVGALVARFQKSEPSPSEVFGHLGRLEELAKNRINKGLEGRVADPTQIDATVEKWAYKIMNQIKESPARRSKLRVSALADISEKESSLEKLAAADKLVQMNVLRRNQDGTYAFHSPLVEYTFVANSWDP